MRVVVLAPSEGYLSLAGVRIRYRRLEAELAAIGHVLRIELIDAIQADGALSGDIYLISKCYDVRSMIAARLVRAAGRRLGIDLFDDYFSQTKDSRFTARRAWFGTMMGTADFVLCSTPAMRDLVHAASPAMPVHVLNDPSPAFDSAQLGQVIRHKLDAMLSTGTLDVAWFGRGDNKYFPVGLADLSTFGEQLGRLGRGRYKIRLEVLTNRGALGADGFEMLSRLSVPFTVAEWSEEEEAKLLAHSLVAFIPVSGQNFSVVKSLNRAISALTSGAQVLSAGYPLYDPLGAFIYHGAEELLASLEQRALKLDASTLPAFSTLLQRWGDPGAEAAALKLFLDQVTTGRRDGPVDRALAGLIILHGRQSLIEALTLGARLGALSVATPFSHPKHAYDISFGMGPGGGMVMRFNKAAMARLAPEIGKALRRGDKLHEFDLTGADATHLKPLVQTRPAWRSSRSVHYEDVMEALRRVLSPLYPEHEVIVSDVESPMVQYRPAPPSMQADRPGIQKAAAA